MGQRARLGEEIGFCIWTCEIEYPHFLFLATSEEMRSSWRYRDCANDVIVGKGVNRLSRVRVPDFSKDMLEMSGTHRNFESEELTR